MEELKYVSFSVAGTKGHMFMGVLDGLEDVLERRGKKTFEEWYASLDGVAGSSAGAIIGLILLLGLDREKRNTILHEISNVQKHLNPDLSLLLRNYGWEDGTALREYLRTILTMGGLSADSTLYDLSRLLRREFVVVCTDLHSTTAMRLSAKTHPTLKVVDAIYASCAVPFVFTPPSIDGVLVADGCLTEDLPQVFDAVQTLFVLTDRRIPPDQTVQTWPEFLSKIVSCASVAQNAHIQSLCDSFPDNVVHVRCTDEVLNMPSMNIHQTEDDTMMLYHLGYLATMQKYGDSRVLPTVGVAVGHITTLFLSTAVVEQPPCNESPF